MESEPLAPEVRSLGAVAGFDVRTVRVDDGVIEELLRLRSPDSQSRGVDRRLQRVDRGRAVEPAEEVAGRRRIRNPTSPEHVEVVLIVAQQLEMLEALPTRKQVVRDVRDVVGLVVRRVYSQPMDPVVDLLVETDRLHHAMDQRHTARRNRADALGDLVARTRAP